MTDDGVRIHFLGSGDAFGSGGRYQTCFWLQSASGIVLIDCGATSLTAIKAAGLEPNDIQTVVLSHLHGDHFGGIPFLVLDGQFRRRAQLLTIGGPPGTKQRVNAAMELLFPGSLDASRRFETKFIEIDPHTETAVGPATVTTIPVPVPDTPACAVRIELSGRTISYTGDTEWTGELLELSRDADLLIAESYFFERIVPTHLSHNELLARRSELKGRRIILTHMGPEMLARQDEAAFECAYDGLVLDI